MSQFKVIFVLGGPGSGKGTQCNKIKETFGYTHLSAGELLRLELNSKSTNAEIIEGYIKRGEIVPVEITISLLEREMLNVQKENEDNPGFLIDGFPRNEDNLHGWQSKMKTKAIIQGVLFFETTDEDCIQRCLSRGESSGRTDDNIESLKQRMKTYHESTMPIINYFDSLQLVYKIDASPEPNKVFMYVIQAFDKMGISKR